MKKQVKTGKKDNKEKKRVSSRKNFKNVRIEWDGKDKSKNSLQIKKKENILSQKEKRDETQDSIEEKKSLTKRK